MVWESQRMQKPFYLLSWAMIFLQTVLWGLFWSLVSIFFSNKSVSFLKSSTGELLHILVSRIMPYSQVNVDQISFLVFFLKIAKIWQNCQNHFHVAVFQMAVKWVRFFCFSNDIMCNFCSYWVSFKKQLRDTLGAVAPTVSEEDVAAHPELDLEGWIGNEAGGMRRGWGVREESGPWEIIKDIVDGGVKLAAQKDSGAL